ncbi:MAG: AAA family ATPase [Clostridia bacterium]|nr:AAA family ATPase [Clostridia bacterium]
MEQEIITIVITGGPCAGKSTAMSRIQSYFSTLGYTVLFVAETATELITGGIAPWSCGSNTDYQKCQMELQMAKENVYKEAARTMDSKKVLIVCDRGVIDNKAYMTAEEFSEIAVSLKTNEIELRDHYDAVFHLVTAAKGAEEFYTTKNNSARTETAKQAAALDDKLIAAWTGHPHFRVIDNSTDFDNKINRLLSEISSFLGEPEPLEIERKFLIEYPDLELLRSLDNCKRVEIIQTYLNSDGNGEVRVRQRGENGHYIYVKTTKRFVTNVKRVEIEKRLSQDEYIKLLMDADTTRHPIRKDRYCITYESQYFELDVYPFWNDKATIEIELNDENAPIHFPDFIHVIKEVTHDSEYKNSSLAKL